MENYELSSDLQRINFQVDDLERKIDHKISMSEQDVIHKITMLKFDIYMTIGGLIVISIFLNIFFLGLISKSLAN